MSQSCLAFAWSQVSGPKELTEAVTEIGISWSPFLLFQLFLSGLWGTSTASAEGPEVVWPLRRHRRARGRGPRVRARPVPDDLVIEVGRKKVAQEEVSRIGRGREVGLQAENIGKKLGFTKNEPLYYMTNLINEPHERTFLLGLFVCRWTQLIVWWDFESFI